MNYQFEHKVIQALCAFEREDARLAQLPETEHHGNPFTVCTTGARWVRDRFFPEAKVMGYCLEENPHAVIGKDCGGHDFLVVADRYLIDFWPRVVQGKNDMPVLLDIQKERHLVQQYYGNVYAWEELP